MEISIDYRTFKDRVYESLAGMGRGLGNAHRLELLDLVAQRPRSVEALALGTERPVANTSQHLQVLYRAGLVRRRRTGNQVVYSLAPGAGSLVALLRSVAGDHLADLAATRVLRQAQYPAVADISDDEVRAGLGTGSLLLIDVRSADEFAHGHIAGARNIPLEQLDAAIPGLPRDREIIACCRGPWCCHSVRAVERLVAAGYRARRFDFGVDDWRLAGGKVEVGPAS